MCLRSRHIQSALTFILACLVLSCGCHTAKTAAQTGSSDQLYAYRWDLIELQGNSVQSSPQIHPFLQFYPGQERRISGSLGCNRLGGTFVLSSDTTITLSPITTTRMACPDANLEYQFSRVLGQADHWQIVNKELQLRIGQKTAAILKASPLE